jgi:anthranilate synthase component I
MTDPWAPFVGLAEGAEVAGYFEAASLGRGGGTASWFVEPDDRLTIGQSSTLEDLSRTTRRFLAHHPRGGVVGYVGFDATGLFEPVLRNVPAGSPFPLGELAFVPQLKVARALPPRGRPMRTRVLGRPRADSLPRARFERGVRELIDAIRAGEAFQVVLAHRRSWARPYDLIERAGELRATERYAYFYYLRFGDREVVGASPESVAELHHGRAWVNPIAGTLPRAPGPVRLPLLNDPKELAEHRMLVDLARNDLGRVARPGTVHLAWRERRVRYARLEHLVSRVGATLERGAGPWELLRATYPAGTVSGAPKIRAVELLREAERTWRGPYAGAVGCLRARGPSDWALAIRGAFAAGSTLYTAAGAGIVHRSEPAREFDETLVKLEHVERALVGSRG